MQAGEVRRHGRPQGAGGRNEDSARKPGTMGRGADGPMGRWVLGLAPLVLLAGGWVGGWLVGWLGWVGWVELGWVELSWVGLGWVGWLVGGWFSGFLTFTKRFGNGELGRLFQAVRVPSLLSVLLHQPYSGFNPARW